LISEPAQESREKVPDTFSVPFSVLAYGRGCCNCRETGYRGRVGIFELLLVDELVRSKIQDRSNASEIRDAALSRGMEMLRADGMRKIEKGLTTVEEVSRVTVRAAIHSSEEVFATDRSNRLS
jgi:type II secretory ATPase GspE/PulE/Tfp pilus assembly ATPase PilB-like protein